MDIKEFEDIKDMSEKAANYIACLAADAIEKRGSFTVALSGGNSPRNIYERLADDRLKCSVDWSKVYLFWGDERFIPHTERDSNYRMAYDSLISRVSIPAQNIFRIPAEVEPVAMSAELYERMLRKFFSEIRAIDPVKKLPVFDLVLLGVGADGHTASLFPGHRVLNEQEKWVVSIKAHARVTVRDRITLTMPVLSSARNIMFIISGAGKGATVKSILKNPDETKWKYPASAIASESETVWFIDKGIY